MAHVGETVCFRKMGEDGVSTFASRMTQGIFAGHHDPTGAIFVCHQECKCWTRQPLSDAWDATNWDGLCGTPWQMVARDLQLTKKVSSDKEGAGPPLPKIAVESIPEVEPRRFYVLSVDIEVHGRTGVCRGCAALASHGKATKPT